MDINKVQLFGYPAIGVITGCLFGLVGMNVWLAISVFKLDASLGINYILQAFYFCIIALACQRFRGAGALAAAINDGNTA
jgi:hypothetical protein